MRKITRMILISAVLATSGLTAKIATENYKAAVTNDERIHKAYELAKKPNKAAVLEAIVDATNAETDERIRDAVVIEPDEPKVVRVKTKVTTSAGVSPKVSTMDKKTVNKAEEFIENVAHPAEIVMEDILEFSPENIPDSNGPVQELTYETRDIFPEFEGETVVVLKNTYDYPKIMIWPEGTFTNTLNHNGGTTYTDGIFTYTLETGSYVRTHDAFLSDTIGEGNGATVRYFESMKAGEENMVLEVIVSNKGNQHRGRMAIDRYTKVDGGSKLAYDGNYLTFTTENNTYTIEGTNDTGIYFKPTGTAKPLLDFYEGIKAGTIYFARKTWGLF